MKDALRREAQQQTDPSVVTMTTHRGQYDRGYLPHWDFGNRIQFITYHLADSLPECGIERLRQTIKRYPKDEQAAQRIRHLQEYLDRGHGCCVLNKPACAELVMQAWRHFDGDRYDLLAWVIMPNHVHVVIRLSAGENLGSVVGSWKKWTARRIATMAHGTKPIWQREYFDRLVRDERHFLLTLRYIHQNPVVAGLVENATAWPWSSAADWPDPA